MDLEQAKLDDAREHEQLLHEQKKPGKRCHIEAAIAEQGELDHQHQVALRAYQRAEGEFDAVVAEHGHEVRAEYEKALSDFREWAQAGIPLHARLGTVSLVLSALREQTDATASIGLRAGQLHPLEVHSGQHGKLAEVPVADVLALLCDLGKPKVEQEVEPESFRPEISPQE